MFTVRALFRVGRNHLDRTYIASLMMHESGSNILCPAAAVRLAMSLERGFHLKTDGVPGYVVGLIREANTHENPGSL